MRRIAIIIPTQYTKTPKFLRRAISSVISAAKRDTSTRLKFFIAVNGTPIDRIELVRRRPYVSGDAPLHIIESFENRGFCIAVNDAIYAARSSGVFDWFIIINDDAVMKKDFFIALHDALSSSVYDAVSCGVKTSRGVRESVGLRYTPVGLAFPRLRDIRPDERALFVGTCVCVSESRVTREIHQHGYLFNPIFFAYAEDLELSLRIHRDGGKIYISNRDLLVHTGSHTAGRGSYFQLYHGYRNLVLIMFLLWSVRDAVIRSPLILLGQVYILGMSIYKKYFLLVPAIWWWIFKNREVIFWQRRHYAQR